MAHRARYSGRPALRPSGHQQIALMFKIAPGDFARHPASSAGKADTSNWILGASNSDYAFRYYLK
jgi:hypothetical protein